MGMTTETFGFELDHSPAGLSIYDELKCLLDTASNLENLLDVFYFETQSWISSTGMRFSNSHKGVRYQVGVDGQYRCNYRLFANQDYLGEISFSRMSAFETDELELIESMLSVAILPIRSQLRYEPGDGER
ncbi:MAG: hypothetical protein KDI19_05335 [Pseudomonadales bacterium]|nr:hypothetical protein [Pseudomonadales bacterium]